jgi:transmembrane sensor
MDMHVFQSPEDLLADESFLAWYYKTDPGAMGEWTEWLNQSESHRVLAGEAVTLLEKLDLREIAVPQAQVDAAEARLLRQVGASVPSIDASVPLGGTPISVGSPEIPETPEVPQISMRGKIRRSWLAAAAVVLLVVAGWTARHWLNGKNTLSTPYGQMAKSVLPDGTEVTLNAHSSLVYGRHWSEGTDREVWVKGEAFLHVAKKPLHDRFIVHTDHFDVIVTGTSFNVVNRDDASNVVLKEGHVTVRSDLGKEVKMEPGEQVQLEGKELVKQSVNPEGVIAWTDGKIEFDSATLADVVKMIERHYGARVTVEKAALLSYPVNGILPNNSLDDLLKALSALEYSYRDLNIEREGDRIIIR